tara:strand:- start:356 stop:652 length:297 start_codon:yes stop_codon:yes gene_type:complete
MICTWKGTNLLMRVMLLRFTIPNGTKNLLTWRNTPLVNFNYDPFDDLVKSEVDKALQYLLDHEMISMEWDPDAEEMVFYMTDKQRAMPKPDDWDEKAP